MRRALRSGRVRYRRRWRWSASPQRLRTRALSRTRPAAERLLRRVARPDTLSLIAADAVITEVVICSPPERSTSPAAAVSCSSRAHVAGREDPGTAGRTHPARCGHARDGRTRWVPTDGVVFGRADRLAGPADRRCPGGPRRHVLRLIRRRHLDRRIVKVDDVRIEPLDGPTAPECVARAHRDAGSTHPPGRTRSTHRCSRCVWR